MLDLIETHVLDLLQGDSRLIAGGNAWSAGFSGALRPANGDTPAAGFVNLFDHVYQANADSFRPGIYLGQHTEEASDSLDFAAICAAQIDYRVITIPLLIAAMATRPLDAKRQRNQLFANVTTILLDHRVEAGYWYLLELPGQSGGTSERVWASATGAGSQGIAEAHAVLPVVVRYALTPTSSA